LELLSATDEKSIISIMMSLVLWEVKDPIAGIILPNLSMNV
jgi:hypothetical protein